MKRTPIATILTVILMLASSWTIAQPFGGGGPGSGMGPGAGMGGRWANGDVTAYVDARLASIKAALAVNTGQEQLWQAFAAAVKAQAQARQALRTQMWTSDAQGADRLTLRAQAMQEQAAHMQAVAAQFARLYAVLSPQQKAIADELFAPRFGPRRTGW